MNKSFWIEKGSGCASDTEQSYGSSSRIESKRTHQWLMEGDEAEATPNKKHIVEVPTHNYFYGLLNSNLSGWSGASDLQSTTSHYTDQLQQDDKNTNFDDRSIPSFGPSNMVLGNKLIEDSFGFNSSFGDPRDGLNYNGIRKVKVSQVKESENLHAYNRGVVNGMSQPHPYGNLDENSVSMGLSFNQINDNILPMGDTFHRADTNNFMSLGQPYNKGNDNTIAMLNPYMENNNAVSMAQSFTTDDNISTMGQTFNKVNENNISYMKMEENKSLSMDNTFGKGNSNIISFGGFQDDDMNSSGGLLCSYDLLMGQASAKRAEARSDRGLVESHVDAIVNAANILSSASKTVVPKKDDHKGNKKVHPNNFPSNVRSLLSTGMLDGVSVKYIAWSREKELCGTIRGSSYLCGCQSCNFSKSINAYEFERHAGCKTKHPNNHIYFENGKTVYGIVQELRNTPQNLLFEVIQTITGSPINQKSFRLWKESFLAATRELQRIYGNDGGKQLS